MRYVDRMDPLAVTIIGGLIVAAVLAGTRSASAWVLGRRRARDARSALTSITGNNRAVHNLGPRPTLVGREEDISNVVGQFSGGTHSILIHGGPGIGKTALAIEVGYRLAESNKLSIEIEHPSHVLYFSARQVELSLSLVLNEIGRWTNNPYVMKKPDLASKQAAVKKLLASKTMLLILDNMESVTDGELINFIDNIPAPSIILLTSRNPEYRLNTPKALLLARISRTASVDLWSRELRSPVDRDSSEFSALLRITEGSPMAIRWAAARLETMSPQQIYENIKADHDGLLSRMFETTWKRLSHESQRTLFAISMFATPPRISDVFEMLDAESTEIPAVLAEIGDTRLLEPDWATSGSAQLHPLILAYIQARISRSMGTDA